MLPAETTLLVGSWRLVEERDAEGRFIRNRAYNSVLVVDGEGRITGSYDKIHLVPLGEYLPFQDFLESLGMMQLTNVRGGFNVGQKPRLLTIPGAPPVTPLICYEIIFPQEITEAGTIRAGCSTSPTMRGSDRAQAPTSIFTRRRFAPSSKACRSCAPPIPASPP